MSAREPKQVLNVYSVVGLAFAAAGAVWGGITVILIQPSFARMLSDFGGEVSAFTKLCLQPWFVIALTCLPLLVAISGLLKPGSLTWQRLRLAVTIFLTLMLPAVYLTGMYMPILNTANAVAP